MKTILITAAALVLAGCSSFKLGAICYLPHGVAGECRMATVPQVRPATPAGAPL
ncbi:hypothetical protein LJR066_002870 [Acidovorax sp. LjRoot66]|uniref:hypothetical protein n=1 Tax=Acidovorax sp. LjRoot66 TaxID=3342334 RepID=UPI003ED0DD90